MNNTRALVTGAGGFIGHHLVKRLKQENYWVRAVDLKEPSFESSEADEFLRLDLRDYRACRRAVEHIDTVYHLAADMGGIGFISRFFASVARNNSLINLHMLQAAHDCYVKKFLFASTACVYNLAKQHSAVVAPLKEEDAYPAAPEKGYGWEKLYAEQLCQYFREEYHLGTHIVRLHNVYGPLGTYCGGREKAPAAACTKVALAPDGGSVEIWGDGGQTRSFLYIDDCIDGLLRVVRSDHHYPLNLGSDELITIDGLFDLVAEIAGKRIEKIHRPEQPQGVRGRNSDNTRIRQVLSWAPSTPLKVGLVPTYRWIAAQLDDASCTDRVKNCDQERTVVGSAPVGSAIR